MKRPYLIVDTETTGLRPFHGDRVFSTGIAIVDETGEIETEFILRIDTKWGVSKQLADLNRKKTQELLSSGLPIVGHNFKFDFNMLKVSGFKIPDSTEIHDTMIQSQIINNMAPSHSLDGLTQLWADYPVDADEKVARIAREVPNYSHIPDDLMRIYQHHDLARTALLHEFFLPRIEENPRWYSDYRNEINLLKTTSRMEETGIVFDKRQAQILDSHLEEQIHSMTHEMYKHIGHAVNLNSTQVVKHLLFNVYKFPVLEINEDSGNAVVDKDILFAYREKYPNHPVLELILKTRSYVKGRSTIRNYIKHSSKESTLHPNIKTNHARSGREAADSPNLQNVSKDTGLKTPYPIPLRKCFRARPGFFLMFFDYSGIEMRLIIEATQEPEMLQILRAGGDPHDIASQIFYRETYSGEKDKKIKKTLRSAGKNAHFALAYGASSGKIAQTLNLAPDITTIRVSDYKGRFPGIGGFSRTTANQVLNQGYVVTSFGRHLRINREKAYSAANYVIQGTAAGILKRAQVNLTRLIDKKYGWDSFRMLVPIHDELIFEISRKYLPKMKEIFTDIRREMITIPDIIVPLEVEAKISTNTWFDAKEFHL